MSQIISFGFDYSPQDFSWNVANVDDFDKVKQYLREDSILIVAEEKFHRFKRELSLLKLAFPEIYLLILAEPIPSVDEIFTFCSDIELDNKISDYRKSPFIQKKVMRIFEQVLTMI